MDLSLLEGFDWDDANVRKNWQRHRVSFDDEEVFFQDPVVVPDPLHSAIEPRFFAYGKTKRGRLLTIIFTQRGKKIRVISARGMSRRERRAYEKT